MERLLGKYGLTQSQYTIVVTVNEQGPVGQQRLARLAAMDARNIVAVPDALETRGLGERRTDNHDRRRRLVLLTEASRHLVAALAKAAATRQDHLLRPQPQGPHPPPPRHSATAATPRAPPASPRQPPTRKPPYRCAHPRQRTPPAANASLLERQTPRAAKASSDERPCAMHMPSSRRAHPEQLDCLAMRISPCNAADHLAQARCADPGQAAQSAGAAWRQGTKATVSVAPSLSTTVNVPPLRPAS